jgi:transposase
MAHEGTWDNEVAAAVGVTVTTVATIRWPYAEGGLEAALDERPHRRRPPKLDGRQEAYLVALGVVDSMSHGAVWDM